MASASRLPRSLQQKYYLHPRAQAHVEIDVTRPADALPVVVLSTTNSLSHDNRQNAINRFLKIDDVFSSDFLTDTYVIQGKADPFPTPSGLLASHTQHRTSDLDDHVKNWYPSVALKLDEISIQSILPEGPYFLVGRSLYQAWRLYPDHLDSFLTTIVPSADDPEKFEILDGVTGDGLWRSVAVPSRLYSTPSSEKPLAGKRISVKDNYKIAGVKTTLSNRAFVDTYGPETETADFLTRLIHLGAVIVGKTKLCAFASSEEATDQWIDFHAPFNPRADGYQSPSGSTTGGATALAGYDWLDYSLGTDTSGSIRWPAAWNGLYGLRTTWRSNQLGGVYPACGMMDTIGFLARNIEELHRVAHATIESSENVLNFPKRILYSTDFFPHSNPAQQDIIEEFVKILESLLGVTRTEISIAERWSQCPPEEAKGKSIREYLDKAAYYPFYYDGYYSFEQFRKDYEAKFGKPVYVGPYMRWKWDMGKQVTLEQKDKSLEEVKVYKQWFTETIMKADGETGSDAILILPCGSGEPKYRDAPNASPGPVPAFSPNYIASVLGLPQVVTPVGQIPFESRVSKRTEYLPVVGGIVGAPGSDLMLINIAKHALLRAKWPTEVLTGRFTFENGPPPRYVSLHDKKHVKSHRM